MGGIRLPVYDNENDPKRTSSKAKLVLIGIVLSIGAAFVLVHLIADDLVGISRDGDSGFEHGLQPTCPRQPDPLYPKIPFEVSGTYRDEVASRLGQAVGYPTMSFDDIGDVDQDVICRCQLEAFKKLLSLVLATLGAVL